MVGVLWGSPLPPVRSGVSDYAVELLPAVAELAPVRVLQPPAWQRPDDWPLDGQVELVPHDSAPLPDEVVLVHLGNNPYHAWLVRMLRHPRSVAVLHDVVLHHLLVETTLSDGRRVDFEQLLEAACGTAGRTLAQARRFGLTGRRDPFLFPAWQAFVHRAAAAVVHSVWAERQLDDCPVPVHRIPLPVCDPPRQDRAALRQRLGVAEGTVMLMHLGFLTPEKGVQEILSGVVAAQKAGIDTHLVLVGEGDILATVTGAARRLDLARCVTATGWVPAAELPGLPAAADLGVVLRRPSAGETSAAVLRFLACGTPVAVSGLRQFLEWPEEAAPRLTPGWSTAAELARLLAETAQARASGRWQQRRHAARQAYEDGHLPEQAAATLVEVVRDVARHARTE